MNGGETQGGARRGSKNKGNKDKEEDRSKNVGITLCSIRVDSIYYFVIREHNGTSNKWSLEGNTGISFFAIIRHKLYHPRYRSLCPPPAALRRPDPTASSGHLFPRRSDQVPRPRTTSSWSLLARYISRRIPLRNFGTVFPHTELCFRGNCL